MAHRAEQLRHRRLVVLRGEPRETAERARALVQSLAAPSVAWVSDDEAEVGFGERIRRRQVPKWLGSSFDAVVLSLHDEACANTLGQCHGWVWGGGALVLRLPPVGRAPRHERRAVTVPPYAPDDVRLRFFSWLQTRLDGCETADTRPVSPAIHADAGTVEQAELVRALVERLGTREPTWSAVLAERGRGKSAALGLVVRRLLDAGCGDAGCGDAGCGTVAVTAGSRQSVREVERFAAGGAELAFREVTELVYGDEDFAVILVDEAAQIPVPLLQRLVRRHPDAHLVFSTTTQGYEGTGRGFVLRFLVWLEQSGRPVKRYALNEPIRWGAGCPLEDRVADVLHLRARPSELPPDSTACAEQIAPIDRDALVQDEALLRAVFGLLVHAHYRTTPDDLRRILDAPNVRLHAVWRGDAVVGVTLIALEGGLSAAICRDLYEGRSRIRGHALAETLCSHSGRPEAGEMQIVRSVRIAVHPEARRQGIASRLVDSIHRAYQPDFFGTLFGATAELLQFRREVGYELVRLGASRGTRTGEPSVAMIRPCTPRAEALVRTLRANLARDLPAQLSLLEAGRELVLDPALRSAVLQGLPKAAPLTDEAVAEAARLFAHGPRTHEASATALRAYVERRADLLSGLEASDRALLEARILEGVSWDEARQRAGLQTIPAVMRACKRAFRALMAAE